MFLGGLSHDKQTFSRTAANAQAAMLLLALAALVLPAGLELIHGGELPGVGEERVGETERLSRRVALVPAPDLRRGAVLLVALAPSRVQPRIPSSTRATAGRAGAR
jgi:hypothetical protein